MDRMTSLTVFTRVVDSGGFSAAARKLDMSTTMVSNHVQALEERLGVRLLNRTTRHVSVTEIGRTYYDRCVQILAQIEEADRLASEMQATPRGKLRLYSNASMVGFITPVVGDFVTAYPHVSVDLAVGERMVDLIEEGYDLAIRTTPPPDSSLIVRRLTPWRHVLCCAPSYLERHAPPHVADDLKQHNCLRYAHYPWGDQWHFTGPHGESIVVPIAGNLVTNNPEALKGWALDGHGILLGPSFLIAEELRHGRLVRLLEDLTPIELAINALYPHRHHLATTVRRFIDLLAERLAAHRNWLEPTT
ncbi:MAG TPA: LysR family transcriptional regulator [Pseudomonadales bacterium]|nr:LysR family transcriptional regulator [Pseudomonadales bacterium]